MNVTDALTAPLNSEPRTVNGERRTPLIRAAKRQTPNAYLKTIGIIRMATIFATLIMGLIAGPDVSL